MAQGGVFNLVLRDTRNDDYLIASDALRSRIDAVRAKRKAAGEAVVEPTLADLEKTHVFYMNSSYRPHVAVASEYAKAQSAGVGSQQLSAAGGTATFTLPSFGHFTSDMVLHIRLGQLGDPDADLATATTFYRYCAYPGVRMLRRVAFESDETLVDDYEPDDVLFCNQFKVDADRRQAWDRCMGQQEMRTAELQNPSAITTNVVHYRDGLQTFKVGHRATDLWVPLDFWLCKSPEAALLNEPQANTQRTVKIDLAPIGDIIEAADAANFIAKASDTIVIPNDSVDTDLIRHSQLAYTGTVPDRHPIEVTLYTNQLWVNPEVHDIVRARTGFSLIRVHRRQRRGLTKPVDSIQLLSMKYPIEYLFVAARDRTNKDDLERWHLMGRPSRPAGAGLGALIQPLAVWNVDFTAIQFVGRVAREASSLEPIFEKLGVTAHNNSLFPSLPESFYNAYLPQRYHSKTEIVASADKAAYMIPFCLHPGQYNPSGYYKLSVGRELFINYEASTVSQGLPAEFVAAGSCLNFLVRKDDKVTLLYTL